MITLSRQFGPPGTENNGTALHPPILSDIPRIPFARQYQPASAPPPGTRSPRLDIRYARTRTHRAGQGRHYICTSHRTNDRGGAAPPGEDCDLVCPAAALRPPQCLRRISPLVDRHFHAAENMPDTQDRLLCGLDRHIYPPARQHFTPPHRKEATVKYFATQVSDFTSQPKACASWSYRYLCKIPILHKL